MKIRGNIRQAIERAGSITMAQFMSEAMYDNNEGYYIKHNPIGKNNDFITAPEISQLFGEMLGIYSVDCWVKMNRPARFNLVELGPGRATLMDDLLRATKHVQGFHKALNIHLVDTNQALTIIQKQRLALYDIDCTWHQAIYSLPSDNPMIIIANEFFDCLPINQYIKYKNEWYEQAVGLHYEEFCYIQTALPKIFSETLNIEYPNSKNGAIVEISRAAEEVIQHLAKLLNKSLGYFLAIDYGYDYEPIKRKAYSGSIQAIKNHRFHPIFSDVGQADLTAHVDFYALKKAALSYEVQVTGSIAQGEFLKKMGIELRAKTLKEKATLAQQEDIDSGYNRLTSSKQMGKLFKAISIFSKGLVKPIGF